MPGDAGQPIRRVIAGHGRLAAARQVGLAEVPVIPLRGLSEVQRRQLVHADSRITLNAGWDMEMMKLELTDLSALGADLSLLGFTKQELAEALAPGVTGGLTDENQVPEFAEKAVGEAGDIWFVDAHRLACGDCTADLVALPAPDRLCLALRPPWDDSRRLA
jgi:ParB-like chromosome segregation protein Spo0J